MAVFRNPALTHMVLEHNRRVMEESAYIGSSYHTSYDDSTSAIDDLPWGWIIIGVPLGLVLIGFLIGYLW